MGFWGIKPPVNLQGGRMNNCVKKIEKVVSELRDKIMCEVDGKLNNFRKEMIEGVESNKRWKPEAGEQYHYLNDAGKTKSDKWIEHISDLWRYGARNCFKTTEEVEDYRRYLVTKRYVMDIAERLNEGKEFDWDNINQDKFYMYTVDKEIGQGGVWTQKGKEIYCLSSDFKQTCLNEIGKNSLQFYLESEFN